MLFSDRDVCEDCDEHVYLFIALWWRAPRHPTLPCPVFFPYMPISAYTDFRFYGTAFPENAESRPPWCSLFSQPGLEPRPYARRRNTSAISFYALGGLHIALATTSICVVRLWVSRCSPYDISSMRLRARRAEAWRRPGFSEQFPRQRIHDYAYTERRVSGNAGLRKREGARSPRALSVLTPRGVPVPR